MLPQPFVGVADKVEMIAKITAASMPLLASGSFAWGRLSAEQQQTVDRYVTRALSNDADSITLGDIRNEAREDSIPTSAHFVNVNEYEEAAFDVALATVGLSSCSALAILEPRLQSHWLAHVMSLTEVSDLIQAINFFYPGPHDHRAFYVLPGATDGNRSGTVRSLSNIFSALVFMGIADKAQALRYTGAHRFASLLLYEGRLYEYHSTIELLNDNAKFLTPGIF